MIFMTPVLLQEWVPQDWKHPQKHRGKWPGNRMECPTIARAAGKFSGGSRAWFCIADTNAGKIHSSSVRIVNTKLNAKAASTYTYDVDIRNTCILWKKNRLSSHVLFKISHGIHRTCIPALNSVILSTELPTRALHSQVLGPNMSLHRVIKLVRTNRA